MTDININTGSSNTIGNACTSSAMGLSAHPTGNILDRKWNRPPAGSLSCDSNNTAAAACISTVQQNDANSMNQLISSLCDNSTKHTISDPAEREHLTSCVINRSGEVLRTLPGAPPTAPNAPSSGGDESSSVSFSFWGMSRRHKLLLCALSMTNFTAWLCFSIMAPFFPKEADIKGVSSTVSGWIFACFALTNVLGAPVFGKWVPAIGSRYMFLAGQFLSGGCTVLFGFLEFVETKDGGFVFIFFCFLVRICSSLGASAYSTASYTITAKEFPDVLGTVFGILETFCGFGLMVGPALGGVLYDAGGFKLPFWALGGFILICLPLNYLILPYQSDDFNKPPVGSILTLILNVRALIVCYTIVMGATVWAALDPTLEPHLRVFDLDPTMVGLIFLLMAGVYAIFSPVWGVICDKIDDPRVLMLIGMLGNVVGLLLIGPSPMLGFDISFNTLWVNLLSLLILGMSCSLATVPSFNVLHSMAINAGLPDNMATSGIVSGIWSSTYSFGDFCGPVFGGGMADVSGFEWTMTYIAFGCASAAFVIFLSLVYDCKTKPKKAKRTSEPSDERTPLLTGSTNTSDH